MTGSCYRLKTRQTRASGRDMDEVEIIAEQKAIGGWKSNKTQDKIKQVQKRDEKP